MATSTGLTPCSPRWRAANPLARERNHQLRQHRLRAIPAIVAKLELAQIVRKILRADVDMRPVDPALQLRPEAFKANKSLLESLNFKISDVVTEPAATTDNEEKKDESKPKDEKKDDKNAQKK